MGELAEIKAILEREHVMTEDSDAARELYEKSRYGSLSGGKVHLSLIEAMYLLEKGKIMLVDGRGKPVASEKLKKKAVKITPTFFVRYSAYRDIRDRGYIIKTALKFGADFRIYDRGVKPGEDHARWIVFPVHETEAMTWYEFAAKNRVAHSTKKKLLIAVVDDEGDVSYWECKWLRP
jgi:tRNA-intron endonuclease, archaea type